MTFFGNNLPLGFWNGHAHSLSEFDPTSLFANNEIGICFLPGTPYGVSYVERTGASATTVCQHNDPVGTYHDLITGRYFTAFSDNQRPIYKVSGNVVYLESAFVGGHGLQSLFSLPQPYERFLCFRTTTWNTNCQVIATGDSNLGFYLSSSSPEYEFYAGSYPRASSGALNVDEISTEHFEGANSWWDLSNDERVTGSWGTANGAGVTLMTRYTGVASFTGRTYGCIVRQGSVGDALASVKNYVASRAVSV